MERQAATRNVSIADVEAETASHVPIGRIVEPKDIVPLVLLLASPLAAGITAQAIAVDGGAARGIQY
jgi:NAD(P)-dependent dehydrogenase (short-subunit alcohol dehydrogenase family)